MAAEQQADFVPREQILVVAQRLFDQRGYNETSLSQIAQAAGVGLEYLHRQFPLKSDLIWDGIDDKYDVLVVALREHRGVGTVGDAIRAALRSVTDFGPEDQDRIAANMETIDRTRELTGGNEERLAAHKQVIMKFIADELGQAPDDYAPRLVGETVWAASVTATRHWATVDDVHVTLADAVDAAVAPILEAYAGLLERPQ